MKLLYLILFFCVFTVCNSEEEVKKEEKILEEPIVLEEPIQECPENEVFHKCGDSCQRECATLGEPCNIRHIKCPNGCYCAEGYARISTGGGACVPIEKCSAKSKSPFPTAPEPSTDDRNDRLRKFRRPLIKSFI